MRLYFDITYSSMLS